MRDDHLKQIEDIKDKSNQITTTNGLELNATMATSSSANVNNSKFSLHCRLIEIKVDLEFDRSVGGEGERE